jgi:hypothetical protein
VLEVVSILGGGTSVIQFKITLRSIVRVIVDNIETARTERCMWTVFLGNKYGVILKGMAAVAEIGTCEEAVCGTLTNAT